MAGVEFADKIGEGIKFAEKLGRAAAIRARVISTVADKRIGDLFDALGKGDKEALTKFTSDDFWAAVDLEQKAVEQPTGSARKEASPET